jgi:tripartite-type tricarboxylate transporter receptor subunit TctC
MKAFFPACWIRHVTLAAAFMALSAPLVLAQNFPQRGIKIIVPFPAGGGADVVARAIGQQLSEGLGRSVIVENVVGAGGTIGTARAAQAAPDGYTLFIGTPSTHGTNVAVYPKLSYDAIKDFDPIGLIATSPLLLIASPTLDVATVGDLIKLAHARPGELAYGSFGTGSINHLAIELFQSMAGIRTNHVPYRGSAPAMTDLIAGRIQYSMDGPAALTFIRAGTVKFLAIGSRKRWGFFPDKPTISESGVHVVWPVRSRWYARGSRQSAQWQAEPGVGRRSRQGQLQPAGHRSGRRLARGAVHDRRERNQEMGKDRDREGYQDRTLTLPQGAFRSN